MKLPLVAAASALLGLAAGYLLFHQPEAPAVTERVIEKVVVAPAPRQAAPSPPPSAVAAPAPTPAPVTPTGANPTTALAPEPVATPQAVVLEEKVAELERQLAIERAIRRGTEGERIEPPPGLPPRFRDEQLLLTTFNQALKQAGFPGQVLNIDCTEHPCIVFGTGFGDRGDLEKLKGQLGPYEDDSFSTYGFGTGDGKKEHRFFGVAVMPERKGPPDEATQKRISYRVNQMHEASKPPKP
jgi:hypothetical protein